MIREIRLRNFAIAADVSVSLREGLNALTGSTGAGKSLVVEAIRWLSGEKVDQGLIRAGEEVASAEAVFELSYRPELLDRLEESGLDRPVDGLLRLRREVKRGGRSRAYVDGALTSASHLASIFERLVELESQHQHTRLQDPAHHRTLLDACGVARPLRDEYASAQQEFRRHHAAVEEWRRRRDEIRARREILDYQMRELREAALNDGEMESLRERVALHAGGARLVEGAALARARLEDEEHGVLGGLSEALSKLGDGADSVAALSEAHESLSQAQELVQEAARELERFADGYDFDPARLDEDQARLAQLESLCRKYGRTERELIAMSEQLERELDTEEWGDEPPARLGAPLEEARSRLGRAGQALLRARKQVARRVAREASSLLSELGMAEAELQFEVEPRRDPEGECRVGGTRVRAGRQGFEEVRLLVRTNRGEALGPVERVASGGELSRLGLVLKTLAVDETRPALIILDEVDAGLGADLGPALARRLRAMADRVQLLVITHVPAVAAAARLHLVARKGTQGARTVSRVESVEGEIRLTEIARMLGSEGEGPRRLARELLAGAAGLQSGELEA